MSTFTAEVPPRRAATRGRALTDASQAVAVDALAVADPDIARIVARCGAPPFWSRTPGFATLVYIVLEQQVSLASARAAYERIGAVLDAFTPEAYLTLSNDTLRACGVSRQKARYTRLIAEAVSDGSLPLDGLARRSDAAVRECLTAITGVGNWTADVYMLTALRRPDLWPVGDLALVKALCEVKGIDEKPSREVLRELGEPYRPYRSVAAKIFWHHYLSSRAPANGT